MNEKEYLVQPEMYGERKADYKKGESINKKWKPITSEQCLKDNPHGTCGNVGSHIVVNKKTKKVEFLKEYYGNANENKVRLYQAISAALALYRIICMIANPIVETEGANGYKVPWTIHLKHVESGEVFGISEWKGAFGVWTRFHDLSELPDSFKKDIKELLDLMFSDKSPHPYDNCTAGVVA